ncbi:MAG: hypothetical protein V4714_10040 [Bacteroidota bacterium]
MNVAFDNKTVKRLQAIEQLSEEDRKCVYSLMDAYLTKHQMQALLQ